MLSQLLLAMLAARPSLAGEPPVTSVAFAPDAKSVVACSQAGLRIYSWPELKLQNELKPSPLNLHDVAFSPTGNQLAVVGGSPSENGSVEIFSWPEGKSLNVLQGSNDSVMSVVWLGISALASASLDQRVT